MWTKMLLGFLPKDVRTMVSVGLRMMSRLNTAEERQAAADYFIEASTSDGYMSAIEWSKWGSMIGWVGRPKG